MARTVWTTAAVFAGAVGGASAAAQTPGADPAVNFAGSNATFAGDCRGQNAALAGSNNSATIAGACRDFQIAGGGNRVVIDMAPGGTIRVYGSDNRVSWTSTGEVDVTTVGQNNTVSRAR